MTNLNGRIARLEEQFNPPPAYRWYHDCHPLVMVQIYLKRLGIPDLSNSEFTRLTGIQTPIQSGPETNESVEARLIRLCVEAGIARSQAAKNPGWYIAHMIKAFRDDKRD